MQFITTPKKQGPYQTARLPGMMTKRLKRNCYPGPARAGPRVGTAPTLHHDGAWSRASHLQIPSASPTVPAPAWCAVPIPCAILARRPASRRGVRCRYTCKSLF